MPASSSPSWPHLEIHGHRGCRGLLPENTLPAFQRALDLGVDALEMDVVISSDRHVVVSHEAWLNPLICRGPAGEPLPPDAALAYNLYQLPYAQIAQSDCGLPHPFFPSQQAQPATKPLLRTVLAMAEAWAAQRPDCRLPTYSIEVKSLPAGDNIFHPAPAEFLDLVLAELDRAEVSSRATLLSFDPRILRQAHRIRPALHTCLLVEAEQAWLPSLQELGFVPTTFGPDQRTVTLPAITALRALYPTLRLVPWTVNVPADFNRLRPLALDGLTTDYPDRLMALRDDGRWPKT